MIMVRENKYKTENLLGFNIFTDDLSKIDFSKRTIINTINPYSYTSAKTDELFFEALQDSDILLPDGVGIVFANRIANRTKIQKVAGFDVFKHILEISKSRRIKCFFLGSSTLTLEKIRERLKENYPNIEYGCFSPPFKPSFTEEDNRIMVNEINGFDPDFLFVGMTAPKQEKWTKQNAGNLKVNVICNIGAVFDFYAGTVQRAPKWMIKLGLEWLYRVKAQPKNLLKRYVRFPMTTLMVDLIKFEILKK